MNAGDAIILAVFVAASIAMIGIYINQAFFYSTHYLPTTYINGEYYGDKTPDDYVADRRQNIKSYGLQVIARECESEIISADDIDLDLKSNQEAVDALKLQNPWLWLVQSFTTRNLQFSDEVKYSQEKLANRVDDLNCIKGTQRQPSDATWKYNKATKTFECVPEDYGTAVIRNEVCRAVEVCVQTMQKELNIANDNRYYNNPSILSDDEKLNHAIEEGNALLAGTVTYTLHDGIVQVDEDVIQKWVKINVKNGTATLKRDKVKKFVQQMAAKHDTLGTPYKFKTQRGDTVEVSGFYGWKINKDKEVELLIKDVKKGKHVDREPEYAYRGEGGADNPFGNTYAEVDLTNQRMYLVKNGKPKMSSDIVTGNVSHGAGTPTGIYRISYKDPDAVLRGPRLSNGEYSYESHVSYWMPFNGGIGFHDATWRSSFGGSIYRSNGSHGCVNMPYSKAKELFDYVYAGMVVIVYN